MTGEQEGSAGPDLRSSKELKRSLVKKFKTIFLAKLTKEDLQAMQSDLQNMIDKDRTLIPESRNRFESRLRKYFHEDVLRREITSLEVLIRLLTPDDLDQL